MRREPRTTAPVVRSSKPSGTDLKITSSSGIRYIPDITSLIARPSHHFNLDPIVIRLIHTRVLAQKESSTGHFWCQDLPALPWIPSGQGHLRASYPSQSDACF